MLKCGLPANGDSPAACEKVLETPCDIDKTVHTSSKTG